MGDELGMESTDEEAFQAGAASTSTTIPWTAAVILGILAAVFFGLWVGARSDLDSAKEKLDQIAKEEAAAQAAADARPDLAQLASKYRMRSIGALERGSETSISMNFKYIDTQPLADLLAELGFSAGIMDRIGNTRALDGTLTAEAPHVQASWTYHPDAGLSIVIERTD